MHRYIFRQRIFGNQNTAGVNGSMARHAFQLQGIIHNPLGIGIFVGLLKFRHLGQRFGQCHKHRDGLGQFVAKIIRIIQHAADIAYRRPRRHGPESDNLRHMVFAVFGLHIFNDIIATDIGKIHINIRHGNTVRIKKAFKQQIVFNRANVGDAQRVANERTGRRAAARSDHDFIILGPVDEVGHNQKIAGPAHAFNYR